MVSQVKPDIDYHYDCFSCGQCSDNTLNRKIYPYFYIDGNPFCPQCYPLALQTYKEEFEGVDTALVQG